ncbi:MAG TPA: phage holin family protein [Chitinophagaceae bacterium]|jgi:ABC-type phosphate/phosphonate transport system permease subunit
MEEQKQGFFEETQELVEDYVSNRLQLFKLQTAEKSSKLVSLLLTVLVMALLGFFILLFLSITAGYFLAQKTGSLFTGFGIVAIFYVVLLVVLLYLRKKFLDKYISNTVIKIFFETTGDDDDTDEKK